MKLVAALMLLRVAFVISLAFVFSARATEVTFVVVFPTELIDTATGVVTPMPAGTVLGTSIDCGPTPTVADFAHGWDFIVNVLQPATTAVHDFPDGTWYCAGHTSVAERDANGNWKPEGPYSDVISFTVPPPPSLPSDHPGLIVIVK